jgi:Na+/H+ antiporter NhaC
VLMGVGIGIFSGALLHHNHGIPDEVAYPGTIFLLTGIALFVGFYLTKKLN